MSAKFKVGQRVRITRKVEGEEVQCEGFVRFFGPTAFTKKKMDLVGVELDEELGSHNGTYEGKTYFNCPDRHGVFVPASKATLIKGPASPTKKSAPAKAAAAKTPAKAGSKPPSRSSTPAAKAGSTSRHESSGSSGGAEVAALKAQLAALQREKDAAESRAADLQKQAAQSSSSSSSSVVHTTTVVSNGGGGDELKLALMDKAVAQELAADLEEELEDMNDRVRELELECDILRAEARLGGGGGSSGGDDAGGDGPLSAEQVVDSVAYKLLKEKSDQLTQALIKVHGQNQGLTMELQKAHKLLREAAANNAELSQTAEQRASALNKVESDLTQTMQRADDNSSAENMVEQLTAQNLALEDKVNAQAEVVAQLESIQETLEQLCEAFADNEKAMEQDYEAAEGDMNNMRDDMQTLADELKNTAGTVQQYREKVGQLEAELAAAKDTTDAEVAAAAAEEQSKMAAMKLQMHQNQAVERSKAVALALAELGQTQHRNHIDLLKTFMPEVFFQTDYNGLRLLLLLEAFIKKSVLIQENVRAEFRVGDDIKMVLSDESDITIDQFAFGTALMELVKGIELESRFVRRALEAAPDEEYLSLAQVFPELAAREAALDVVLARIQGDGLDPRLDLGDLRVAMNHVARIAGGQLRTNHPPEAEQCLRDNNTSIGCSVDTLNVELRRLQATFRNSTGEGSVNPAFGDVLGRLGEMEDKVASMRSLCLKITRRMPDSANRTVVYDDEVREQLTSTTANLRKAAAGMVATYKGVYMHMHHDTVTARALTLETAMQLGANNQIDLSEDGSMAAKAVAEGADESLTPIVLGTVISEAAELMGRLADALEKGDYDADKTESTAASEPVWTARANRLRSDMANTMDLPLQLNAKTEEVNQLKSQMQVNKKSLREKSLLLEAAKMRVDSLKHTHEKNLKDLEAKFEEDKKEFDDKRREFEETLDALDEDIRAVETERDELRSKLETSGGRRRLGDRIIKSGGDASSADVRAARMEAEVMRVSLTQALRELARLRGTLLRKRLTELPKLQLHTAPAKATASASASASDLLKKLRLVSAAPLVVDVSTKEGEATKPAASQLASAASDLAALRTETDKLRLEVLPLLASAKGRDEGVFGPYLPSNYVKVIAERQQHAKIGTITLPASCAGGAAAGRRNRSVALNPDSFAELHALLV